MATETIIYKYPNIKELFESNISTSINPIYLNPHAELIEFAHSNEVDACWFSRNSSNAAVEMMMANPALISPQIILNNNPNIEPLLEMIKSQFNSQHWSQMAESHNPAVLAFLEKHPEYIDWNWLSGNECDEAIRMLQNNQDKIVWWICSSNASALEILKNNRDKIDWWSFCKNTNPKAIEIVEQMLVEDPSKINISALSSNPNAIHIISQNLDKMDPHYLSRNPKAMEILIEHPELINFDSLLLNPSAIPYLETQIERFPIRDILRLTENPNCLPLIQKMLDADMIPDDYITDLVDRLFRIKSVYDLDYQKMSKQRSKLLYPEISNIALHQKWLDDYCADAGEDDFEM
jgi:hypothetical protein